MKRRSAKIITLAITVLLSLALLVACDFHFTTRDLGEYGLYDDIRYTLSGSTYEVTGVGALNSRVTEIKSSHNGVSVTKIGQSAFALCSNVVSLEIPSSIVEIKAKAFLLCQNLTTLTLNEGLEYIGASAFAGCAKLKTIYLPSTLRSIGRKAFEGCDSLTAIYYCGTNVQLEQIYAGEIQHRVYYYTEQAPELNEQGTAYQGDYWYSDQGEINVWDQEEFDEIVDGSQGLRYELNADGQSYTVTSVGNCKDTSIIVPEYFKGLPVTVIGKKAFYDLDDLTSVALPDTITTIEDYAFCGCNRLTTINFPKSLKSIELGAFGYCAVTDVILPEGLQSIGEKAFVYSAVQNIEIPNSLTYIGSFALHECENLMLREHDNAYYLGNQQNPYLVLYFIDRQVTSFKVLEQTKFIYTGACFEGELQELTIPASVINIGEQAFAFCASLESIYYEGSWSQWGEIKKGDNWNLQIATKEIICLGKAS